MKAKRTFLERVISNLIKHVPGDYGFELTWSEKAALKHYVQTFANGRDENPRFDIIKDSLQVFMYDYFGLDNLELGLYIFRLNKNVRLPLKIRGLDLLGDDRFKEYCQRNINFWRDQRNLI